MYGVIIVDDEVLAREAIGKNILWNDLGYELVAQCEDGQDAINYLKNHKVDLVLTDINMPYINGLELSKYIYEYFPETRVIIFSGYNEFSFAQQAIRYQVSDYLLKPVTPDELKLRLLKMKTQLDQDKQQQAYFSGLKKTKEAYTKNRALIVSSLLQELIMGGKEVEDTLRELKQYNIELTDLNYCIAVLIPMLKEGETTDKDWMLFALNNICDEICREYNLGVAFYKKSEAVYLLLHAKHPIELKFRGKQLLNEIKETYQKYYNNPVSIRLGLVVTDLKALCTSYTYAKKVSEYCYLKGNSEILEAEEWQKEKLNDGIMIEPYLKRITDCVCYNKDTNQVFLDFLSEIKPKYIKKAKVISGLIDFIKVVSVAHQRLEGEQLLFTRLKEQAINAVTGSETVEEGLSYVGDYVKKIQRRMTEIAQKNGKRLAVLVVKYLEDNYQNPELTLSHVCSHFAVSISYFSSFFKEMTGETFMEALTRIRIVASENLLSSTSLKNYEIADRVGYKDPHYFNIVFKKFTGMTPKEYRKRVERGEDA